MKRGGDSKQTSVLIGPHPLSMRTELRSLGL